MKKLFRLMMLGMVLLTGCSSSTGVVGKATVNPITLLPTINSRLISWASNTTSLLFDRKLMRQVQVASAIPFVGDIASHFLISTAPLTAADNAASVKGLPYHHVIRIIDTSTLP